MAAHGSTVEAGEIWTTATTSHPGWLVRVLKVSRGTVEFLCLRGPGRSRGSTFRMRREVFLECYRSQGGGR